MVLFLSKNIFSNAEIGICPQKKKKLKKIGELVGANLLLCHLCRTSSVFKNMSDLSCYLLYAHIKHIWKSQMSITLFHYSPIYHCHITNVSKNILKW